MAINPCSVNVESQYLWGSDLEPVNVRSSQALRNGVRDGVVLHRV